MLQKKINSKTWWEKRDNLSYKPSLSYRTLEVIKVVMEDENINLGLAIERLMTTPGLYKKILKKLEIDYPDITQQNL